MAARLLKSGVGLGFLFSGLSVMVIFTSAGGWRYYTTPLAVRGYEPAHALLRPSAPIGHTLGLLGTLFMLVPFLYMLRKRLKTAWWPGSMKAWLEVHLFCGIAGPVLITLHTSFKFNGIVSAAYWSMVGVALSGFVGRYLYVRIPRSLRGTELSRAELDRRADDLLAEESVAAGAGPWLDRARALENAGARPTLGGLLFGEIRLRSRLRRFTRDLATSDLDRSHQAALVRLVTERALLVRRIAYLQRTKSAFALWHVFHVPFVYFLLVIVTLHVGVTLYLGYVPFRW